MISSTFPFFFHDNMKRLFFNRILRNNVYNYLNKKLEKNSDQKLVEIA